MSVSITSTVAKDVQDAVVAYLGAREELALVPVLGRRRSNIVNDIQAAINRAGVCVYVFPALPVRLNANNPGPYVDELMVRCRAIEHPTLNVRGPDVYEVVELLLRLLDRKTFAIPNCNPLWFDANPVQVADEAAELVQWDVVAYTSTGLAIIT